jgi:DNA-binding MarR family transcriptional regulator
MTTTAVLYGRFGYTLAFAERTLTAQLRQHLAERDVKPESWYALRLIAAEGPGLPRAALTHELEGSRGLNANSTLELLAQLEADGLISGETELDLTPEGDALYRSLREYIAGPASDLLSQFNVADVETTVRTLQAIAEHAQAELVVATR